MAIIKTYDEIQREWSANPTSDINNSPAYLDWVALAMSQGAQMGQGTDPGTFLNQITGNPGAAQNLMQSRDLATGGVPTAYGNNPLDLVPVQPVQVPTSSTYDATVAPVTAVSSNVLMYAGAAVIALIAIFILIRKAQ